MWINDFNDELAAMLPKERVERAKREAGEEILQISLSELRKKMGVRQEDIKGFSQSSVSKLEYRKDIKLSTLIEYLDNLGLGIEIKAFPKDKGQRINDEFVLLRS
ncbi:MAG: XRE family transcriptional regulator [bacterium]|nr:XRE family transcriptional regulator [bacterium]